MGSEASGLANLATVATIGDNANTVFARITLEASSDRAEMVRFGKAMGAEEETFLGLAGVGDLMARTDPFASVARKWKHGQRSSAKYE